MCCLCMLLSQVFFAKVPPTALANEVESLFGSFGKLAEVNLFRAWAGAKHSKVGKHRHRPLFVCTSHQRWLNVEWFDYTGVMWHGC